MGLARLRVVNVYFSKLKKNPTPNPSPFLDPLPIIPASCSLPHVVRYPPLAHAVLPSPPAHCRPRCPLMFALCGPPTVVYPYLLSSVFAVCPPPTFGMDLGTTSPLQSALRSPPTLHFRYGPPHRPPPAVHPLHYHGGNGCSCTQNSMVSN